MDTDEGLEYGQVHTLFRVPPRNDCDHEALTAVLSHLAGSAKLQRYVTDTKAAADKVQQRERDAVVWPLDYVRSQPVSSAVVQQQPLVLRAAALLEPAQPKLSKLLPAIYGQTVVVLTKEAAHENRSNFNGGQNQWSPWDWCGAWGL